MITIAAPAVVEPREACPHNPVCPTWDSPDHDAAAVLVARPEQGWSRLCNGVVVFDDEGEILPDRTTVPAHNSEPRHEVHAQVDGAAACGRSGRLTTVQSDVDCWRCNGAIQAGAR